MWFSMAKLRFSMVKMVFIYKWTSKPVGELRLCYWILGPGGQTKAFSRLITTFLVHLKGPFVPFWSFYPDFVFWPQIPLFWVCFDVGYFDAVHLSTLNSFIWRSIAQSKAHIPRSLFLQSLHKHFTQYLSGGWLQVKSCTLVTCCAQIGLGRTARWRLCRPERPS